MCVEHDCVVEEGGLAAGLQDAPQLRVHSGQVGEQLRVRLQDYSRSKISFGDEMSSALLVMKVIFSDLCMIPWAQSSELCMCATSRLVKRS